MIKWCRKVGNNMNQDSSNSNQSNYNSQGNDEIQNQLLSTNQNNNIQQPQKTKKKLKWWIPLLLFLGGYFMTVCSTVAEMVIRSQEDLVLDYQIENYPAIRIFRWLAVICWLLVIPSLIIVIVKYNVKKTDEKNQENIQINNMINNATSLDEKLLIAYIGNNYQKIMLQKFSVPALFLSWLYTLYRKVYIPSIIGMSIIFILGFLPNVIYSMVVCIFVIVLGINFNKWYIAYVKNKIQKIKTNNPNVYENELISICRVHGGTNIWIAIAIYIVFVIIQTILL